MNMVVSGLDHVQSLHRDMPQEPENHDCPGPPTEAWHRRRASRGAARANIR